MTRRIAVFLLAIFLPLAATAVTAVEHDSTPPPHGGVAADAGPYYCELVVGGGRCEDRQRRRLEQEPLARGIDASSQEHQ